MNIGIATTTDRGLYVPVVKNCEAMNIWELGGELGRVAGAARDGEGADKGDEDIGEQGV